MASVLLCLTLLTTWLTFGLFARYTAGSDDSSSAVVAVMASDVDITLDELLLYPGIEYDPIEVTLTNQENGVVCEVSQSYSFKVSQLTEDLPLTIGVYSDATCRTKVADVGEILTGEFVASTQGEETYYIKVSWDESYNAASYADEIDYLCLSVTATQID